MPPYIFVYNVTIESYCKVLLYIDAEFRRGRGGPSRKIMEIPGVDGSTVKPIRRKNPGAGVGGKTEKKTAFVGGMGIFWKHTFEKG